MRLAELKLRWRALIRRRKFEQEVEDELEFHLEMRRESLQQSGMTARQARDRAQASFGSSAGAAETLREMRGLGWVERLWQDVRFALRQLRLNPGFTAGAALPLALAIGCGAAILTLADAVLFRPMGVKNPDRVAAVYPLSRVNGRYLSNSYPDFRDVAALTDQVEAAAAYIRFPLNVRFTNVAESMNSEFVSGDYFRAAGITPVLGRALTPEDDQPGAAPVALASYALWETRYQRSASILGTAFWVDGKPFTIVGVMPKGYQGMLLDWYADPQFWIPLTNVQAVIGIPDYRDRREMQMFMILARLRSGVSVPQFQAALDVAEARIPGQRPYRLMGLASGQARFFPSYREGTIRFLWLLLAVSIVAVSIACFNLANLLLARCAARGHEMSARAAVGASRARLIQQLTVEHATLAGCAGLLAIPVAFGVTEWLKRVQFTYIFRPSLDLTPDWRALAIGMGAGLITAVVAGVIPAIKAARGSSVAAGLSQGRAARSNWRDIFVCGQVACAMAVLVSAGVLAKTLHRSGDARLGYDSNGVLLASPVGLPAAKTRALLDEVRARTGNVALAQTALPTTFTVQLVARSEGGEWKGLAYNFVSDGYFELLHIPIIGGRGLLPTDDSHGQPVVALNRAAAELFWPGQNPVGRRIRLQQEQADREVVGLVDNVRFRPLGQADSGTPVLFVPLFQRRNFSGGVLHVRTSGDPVAFAGTLRRILAEVAPDASLMDVHTLADQVEAGLKPMQVAQQAVSAVSVLGVLLALMGIFASAAYRVRQQKKEIAIRIAIGAEPRRVVRSFAARGLWIGIVGAGIGLPVALWGVRLLRAAVVGTGAADPWILAAAAIALALAAFAAALAAASRVARVDPADVLRVQ